MAYEFRLPDIGEGLTEAEVIRWLVEVGETVTVDQALVEVETDKAVVELPSPRAGTVLHQGAGPGETLAVGEILVVIGEASESWPPQAGPGSDDLLDMVEEATATQEGMPEAAPPPAPIVGTIREDAEELSPRSQAGKTAAGPGRVQALPLVRKLAAERGVDLNQVQGSGPEGRITREDVMAAADSKQVTPVPAPPPSPEGERRPLSKLRRTIASNMARSWAEIPHVTTFDEVDATRLLGARRALETRHQTSIPLEALVIKAVIPALAAYPELNATLEAEEVVFNGRCDIGVAVDTPDGLLVGVVRAADRRPLLEVAEEVGRLASGARERKLTSGELSGQTFTVSNIGALGGGFGTPIVPPGTTAILSVGRAVDKPVAIDGKIAIAPLLPLSLSYDHRLVDGGLGRRFMAMVLENLAEPALFLAFDANPGFRSPFLDS